LKSILEKKDNSMSHQLQVAYIKFPERCNAAATGVSAVIINAHWVAEIKKTLSTILVD
jgi:hypothetical protein